MLLFASLDLVLSSDGSPGTESY